MSDILQCLLFANVLNIHDSVTKNHDLIDVSTYECLNLRLGIQPDLPLC